MLRSIAALALRCVSKHGHTTCLRHPSRRTHAKACVLLRMRLAQVEDAMLGPILETLIGGLLTGVLYSLVALGFVLIFKASGVFNFAQGAMVLFAALSLVRLMEKMPLAAALAVTVGIMIVLAWLV